MGKFRERFSNGAVTGPAHKQNKRKQAQPQNFGAWMRGFGVNTMLLFLVYIVENGRSLGVARTLGSLVVYHLLALRAGLL